MYENFKKELKKYEEKLRDFRKSDIDDKDIHNFFFYANDSIFNLMTSQVVDLVLSNFSNAKILDIEYNVDKNNEIVFKIPVVDNISILFNTTLFTTSNIVQFSVVTNYYVANDSLIDLYINKFILDEEFNEKQLLYSYFSNKQINSFIKSINKIINKTKRELEKTKVKIKYILNVNDAYLSVMKCYKNRSFTTFKYFELLDKNGNTLYEGVSKGFDKINSFNFTEKDCSLCDLYNITHLKNVPTYKSYTHFLKASGVKRNECNIKIYEYNKNLKCNE